MKFTCDQCGKAKESQGIGTGYGLDDNGQKICYECCGENDKAAIRIMDIGEKTYLYLSKDDNGWCVSNWPGTLKIRIHHKPRKGGHNFAGCRYDVWFEYYGKNYWGVQYGDNTQICHITRIR